MSRDWEEIYITIKDNEYLTLKQVALIANTGQHTATNIRNTIREEIYKTGKEPDNEQTPTDLLLKHLGKTRDYYRDNCFEQLEMEQLKNK